MTKMKRKTTKKINDLHREEEIEVIHLRSLKNEIYISCSSSMKTNMGHNDAEYVKEAVGLKKKAKKFRSIVDLYIITKPSVTDCHLLIN